jgi:hypothetical protein
MVSRRMGGAITDRLSANRIDMHLAPSADQRDQAGHLAPLDIAGHDVVHTGEPRPGQSRDAHCLIPPFCLICVGLLLTRPPANMLE